MKRPSRRGLITLALTGSLGAAVGLLPACSGLSEVTTQTSYAPSDGVNVQFGDIAAANLIVIGTKGHEGVLSGALLNHGRHLAEVTIQTDDQTHPVTVRVPAGRLVTIGGAGSRSQVVVGELEQPAGMLMTVTLSTPASGQVEIRVPVLPPAGPYATVTPTAD